MKKENGYGSSRLIMLRNKHICVSRGWAMARQLAGRRYSVITIFITGMHDAAIEETERARGVQ